MSNIQKNVQMIQTIIEKNVSNSPDVSYPQTIVVTKRQSFEDISHLYQLGYRHFGENRVDALLERQAYFTNYPDIVWHLIGSLQTRKVKDIIQRIHYFHALDRIALINEIEKRALTPIKCFLQVNVFQEATKHGFLLEQVTDICQYISENCHNIEIVGLMTMAPYQANDSLIKNGFMSLKQKQKEIEAMHLFNCPCHFLSMGMSQDYPIAIQVGATHLRIGSAFFE